MNISNKKRLDRFLVHLEKVAGLHVDRQDYKRWKIPLCTGSVYLQTYNGWIRITTSGPISIELATKYFGPNKETDCKMWPSWALR